VVTIRCGGTEEYRPVLSPDKRASENLREYVEAADKPGEGSPLFRVQTTHVHSAAWRKTRCEVVDLLTQNGSEDRPMRQSQTLQISGAEMADVMNARKPVRRAGFRNPVSQRHRSGTGDDWKQAADLKIDDTLIGSQSAEQPDRRAVPIHLRGQCLQEWHRPCRGLESLPA